MPVNLRKVEVLLGEEAWSALRVRAEREMRSVERQAEWELTRLARQPEQVEQPTRYHNGAAKQVYEMLVSSVGEVTYRELIEAGMDLTPSQVSSALHYLYRARRVTRVRDRGQYRYRAVEQPA